VTDGRPHWSAGTRPSGRRVGRRKALTESGGTLTSSLNTRAWLGFAFVAGVMALALFAPAGTVRYAQAWAFLGIYFGAMFLTTRFLMKRDAALLLLFTGNPLALGSYWGLLALVPAVPALIWRLLDEERFLVQHLPGHGVHCARGCGGA